MKVEKINKNKIKITLTMEELADRKIDIKEIKSDVNAARDFFLDLILESDIEQDFAMEDSQLFIEASADKNNLFVITVTKLDHIPELANYIEEELSKSFARKAKKSNKNNTSKVYRVKSNIFYFNSIDIILNMCDTISNQKLFFGKNSLYKYNGNYILVFSPTSVKNKKFLKTFSTLSEYCDHYSYAELLDVNIKEKSKLIIADKAIQKLMKF